MVQQDRPLLQAGENNNLNAIHWSQIMGYIMVRKPQSIAVALVVLIAIIFSTHHKVYFIGVFIRLLGFSLWLMLMYLLFLVYDSLNRSDSQLPSSYWEYAYTRLLERKNSTGSDLSVTDDAAAQIQRTSSKYCNLCGLRLSSTWIECVCGHLLSCVICYQPVIDDLEIIVLSCCQSYIHKRHISQISNICPYCRSPYRLIDSTNHNYRKILQAIAESDNTC